MTNLKRKITHTAVNELQPNQTVWDTEIRGLCIRRQKRDKVYSLKTRVNGRQRWIKIGQHGIWTPQTARRRAQEMLVAAARGEDPTEILTQRRNAPTIGELCDAFLDDHGPRLKERTVAEYRSLIERFIKPEFGTLKSHEATRQNISQFHGSLSATPRQANHMLAVLRKTFNWAIERDLTLNDQNPCSGVIPFSERKRDRYLTLDELETLGRVLDDEESSGRETPFVIGAIKLLMLTGARKNEILTLKWDYIDTDRNLISLPDSKTGAKALQLSNAALEVLNNLPRIQGNPFVIPGEKEGMHLVNLQKPWNRIRNQAGLDDVRIHDLRHTYASLAINSGVPLAILSKLLGQSQLTTTERYAHLADDPAKLAARQVSEGITKALGH